MSGSDGAVRMSFWGHGRSTHFDTCDSTEWKNVVGTLKLNWTDNGVLQFSSSGLSILERALIGATQCQEEMKIEIREERWAREKMQVNIACERFVGPVFTVKDIKPIKEVAPQLPNQLAILQKTAEKNRLCRELGGDAINVGVPFILTGTINMKTGEARLLKSHYRYVYNTIDYDGSVSVTQLNRKSGQEEKVAVTDLVQFMESMNGSEAEPEEQFTIRLKVASSYSGAVITLRSMASAVVPVKPHQSQTTVQTPAPSAASSSSSSSFSAATPPSVALPNSSPEKSVSSPSSPQSPAKQQPIEPPPTTPRRRRSLCTTFKSLFACASTSNMIEQIEGH